MNLSSTEEIISTLECPNAMKGQLIGPRGATIRRLQEESGAKINVASTTSTVTIRGTHTSVQAATNAINSILHPPSTTLTCSTKYVGQLIGPRGSTIKRLQQETGARINVDSQSQPCTITISASTQDIVDNAVLSVNNIIHPKEIVIICKNSEFIGQLIGPRGSNIRRLQEETGARIDVNSNASPPIITITGSTAAIRKNAELEINNIIHPPQVVIECQSSKRLGRLIGPKGSTIKYLQEMTGTRINVTDNTTNGGTVVVKISGTMNDNVVKAQKYVKGLLDPYTMELTCVKEVAGAIIGDHGENINELKSYLNKNICQNSSHGYEYKTNATPNQSENPLQMYVDVDILGAWYDDDERTITVQVLSNDESILKQCATLVQHEIDAAVRSQDYTGEEGKKLRDQANAFSAKRSRLLDLSQQAYVNGNGEEARRLANEGKEAGESANQCNVLARDVIYKYRNAGKENTFLDLHGLFVKEALYYLELVLMTFLSNDVVDTLECVTGAGHHSPMGHGKIKEAVHELVERLGLRYEIKNEGCYMIYC